MKRIAVMIGALLVTAGGARAQVGDCPGCILGIWDDVDMTRNSGTIEPLTFKDIYIGVRLADGISGLQGIEFSIAGMSPEDGFLMVSPDPVEVPPWDIRIGKGTSAPADTSATSRGEGGLSVFEFSCSKGQWALVRIELVALAPVSDRVFRVLHKFPPSDPRVHTPLLFACDTPNLTPIRVTGGCYFMNWHGDPPASCDGPTAVQARTWSGMKALFRPQPAR